MKFALALASLLLAAPSFAMEAKIGETAPAFSLTDINGKNVSLADYKGKTVVLEWFNPGCPFVVRAHGDKGSLETLAAEQSKEEVAWLAINSGASGKQGHGAEVNKAAVEKWNLQHPVLLDEDGTVGKAYGATTTPHMYVVDAKGVLVYAGAIDNNPSGQEVPKVRNYVSQALAQMKADEPIKPPQTKPYGCSVKY
jgi:peroxiredoxin